MNIKIISKDNCAFCTKAKNLLNLRNLPFEEIKFPNDISREQIVEQYPNARTFPVIIIDDTFIGGFDKLSERLENDGFSKISL